METDMNPRISELWDSAAAKAAYSRSGETSWESQVNFIETFAELIVRECKQVVAVHVEKDCKPDPDWGWDEYGQGYVAGLWAATRLMKEHFGIEEWS